MVRDSKVRLPPVRLVSEITGKIRQQLASLGMFRCGVLIPNCSRSPYAEVLFRPDDGTRGLFCEKHARGHCIRLGYELPAEDAT